MRFNNKLNFCKIKGRSSTNYFYLRYLDDIDVNLSIEERLVLCRLSYMYSSTKLRYFGYLFTSDDSKARYISYQCNTWNKLCKYCIGRTFSRDEYTEILYNVTRKSIKLYLDNCLNKELEIWDWSTNLSVVITSLRLVHILRLDKKLILDEIDRMYGYSYDIRRLVTILRSIPWSLNSMISNSEGIDVSLYELLYEVKENIWKKLYYNIQLNKTTYRVGEDLLIIEGDYV